MAEDQYECEYHRLKYFVDREEHIRRFVEALHEPPERWQHRVIHFHGEGGIGKSTLADYIRERICRDRRDLAAPCDPALRLSSVVPFLEARGVFTVHDAVRRAGVPRLMRSPYTERFVGAQRRIAEHVEERLSREGLGVEDKAWFSRALGYSMVLADQENAEKTLRSRVRKELDRGDGIAAYPLAQGWLEALDLLGHHPPAVALYQLGWAAILLGFWDEA